MSNVDANTQPPGNSGAQPGSIVQQAQNFTRDIKDQAGELTKDAAGALKTQAENLTASAKDLASDAGEKLRATVVEQKAAGAEYVEKIATIIRRTSHEFDSDLPRAGQYIRMAADQLGNVSEAMRNRDVSEIVGNVQDFARKQPTAFFGAAVLIGFAAVRFLKSGSDAAASSNAVGNVGGSPQGL